MRTVSPTTDDAVLPSARRRVLDLLRRDGRADAKHVAEALGLHVSTARFHLDALTASGLVDRAPAAERAVGRPRVVYRPVASGADAYRLLAEALVRELAEEGAAGRARAERVGLAWAASRPAGSELVAELAQAGFDPRPGNPGDDPSGDPHGASGASGAAGVITRVEMRACPYLDLARQHPDVVCAVHKGLIEGLVAGERPGPVRREVELVPFATDECCVVHITQR